MRKKRRQSRDRRGRRKGPIFSGKRTAAEPRGSTSGLGRGKKTAAVRSLVRPGVLRLLLDFLGQPAPLSSCPRFSCSSYPCSIFQQRRAAAGPIRSGLVRFGPSLRRPFLRPSRSATSSEPSSEDHPPGARSHCPPSLLRLPSPAIFLPSKLVRPSKLSISFAFSEPPLLPAFHPPPSSFLFRFEKLSVVQFASAGVYTASFHFHPFPSFSLSSFFEGNSAARFALALNDARFALICIRCFKFPCLLCHRFTALISQSNEKFLLLEVFRFIRTDEGKLKY